MSRTTVRCLFLSVLLAGGAPLRAQDWTDDELLQNAAGFQAESLVQRLEQVGKLLGQQQRAFPAIVARIHGDHREYMLKVDRLIGELADARWRVREEAERTLVEIGGRAQELLQQRAEQNNPLEIGLRCKRILDALRVKGTEQEDRDNRLLRGLVILAGYMQPDERLLRALRSALGHTDSLVVDGAIRSLGTLGQADDADAVFQLLDWKGGIYRQATLAALPRMPNARALELVGKLIAEGNLSRSELCRMTRILRERSDSGPLLAQLAQSADPVVAAGARLAMPAADPNVRARVQCTLPDRSMLAGTFLGFAGDTTLLADAITGLPKVGLPMADCDVIDFPDHKIGAITGVRVFLNQGSQVTGSLIGVDEKSVRLSSPVFGQIELPRSEVQGIAIAPEFDRLVGASVDHDRVRMKDNTFVDGKVTSVGGGAIVVAEAGGKQTELKINDVAGLLMQRPRVLEPDPTIYVRCDLVTGDRIIGFVVGSTASHFGLSAPLLGAAVVPVVNVCHLELGVGGGAMWGYTLIADYSDNRILEVDDQGRVAFQMDDVFGAWDAECLDNGNLLITEFSISRVQEVDRKGNQIWVFEDLKNPYDADRLPNGNTLIADTFGSRVIEVNKQGEVVWKYDKEIRPFDADRLPNGNTLIADVLKDRVIEVSPQGEIVWELKGMNNVHDADRLPNGNTLITLRSKLAVIEVDREGKVVWEIGNLQSPSDADRLPNGHTIVAENTQVREFDRRGNVVWRKEMTWAVEVNRY